MLILISFMAEAGLTGLTFRPERYNGLELFDPEMDRVWSAAHGHWHAILENGRRADIHWHQCICEKVCCDRGI